jgi:DNA ligase-like protein
VASPASTHAGRTGLTDAQHNNLPRLGSFITLRYQELFGRLVFRFPSFVGVQSDADPTPMQA